MCIYFYMFKLQSPSKYSIGDGIHLSRYFFPLLKTVSELIDFWCLLVLLLLVYFCFFPHRQQCFPLEIFFFWGNKQKGNKKVTWGWDRVNRKSGAWGSCHFSEKLLNTQWGVGRCPRKSPILKWANVLSLQKNSLKLNAASHNNAS